MNTKSSHHRTAHPIDANLTPDFDDFPLEPLEEKEFIAQACPYASIKIEHLVPSGTTQSWVVNKVAWLQRQSFNAGHEYGHFLLYLSGERYPQDVTDFCRKHGLTDKLDLVVELVSLTFPEAESLTVEMEHDPESQGSWVLVDARVSGPAKAIRLRHRECVRRLLNLLPWPMSTLIRTTYTLAS